MQPSDLNKRVEQAATALDPRWSKERESVVGQRLARKLRQRTRARRAGLVAVAAALVAAAGAVTLSMRHEPTAPLILRFADGSFATALRPETVLVARVDRPDQTAVELASGSARFEVVHRPGQHFRVEAAQVSVEVIGTRFNVERDHDLVRVTVERGQVHVRTPWGEVDLTDGQNRVFSPPATQPAVQTEASTPPAPAPPETPAEKPAADWHTLARAGDFERAYDVLARAGPVHDAPQELLLASDVARLSGHPQQAAEDLGRLLQHHPKDPRAPLAAFTLGRVLLDELGRPREAAEAFAKLRSAQGAGPLAEDALAREVEAWSRAGELDKARAAAQAYVTQFPDGQRLRGVRRYGGLE